MAYKKDKDETKKYGRGTKKSYDDDDYRDERSSYGRREEQGPSHLREERPDYHQMRVEERKVVSQRALPRMDDDAIKPLRLVSDEVVGGIFDRVNFLEARIAELRENISIRKQIHENIADEIQKDVDDRNNFIMAISDANEKRNLKLDISVLRKERRHEDVQYWRDLVELNAELRQLQEEYEIERKIAGIFGSLKGGEDGA